MAQRKASNTHVLQQRSKHQMKGDTLSRTAGQAPGVMKIKILFPRKNESTNYRKTMKTLKQRSQIHCVVVMNSNYLCPRSNKHKFSLTLALDKLGFFGEHEQTSLWLVGLQDCFVGSGYQFQCSLQPATLQNCWDHAVRIV